jgi:hypothetical protein
VSQQSGWIAPVVLVGGSVRGTWEVAGDALAVAWFKESGAVPRGPLLTEIVRLSSILGRELRLAVHRA